MMLQEQSLMRPIYSESAYTQTAPTVHFNLEENNSNIKNEYNYPEVIITEYPNIEESNSNIEMKSMPKNATQSRHSSHAASTRIADVRYVNVPKELIGVSHTRAQERF
jgi:hypothetical protein